MMRRYPRVYTFNIYITRRSAQQTGSLTRLTLFRILSLKNIERKRIEKRPFYTFNRGLA